MTTATTRTVPQLLSPAVHAGVAVAAVALVAALWTGAGRSSHHAVEEAQIAMNRVYVTLPTVEVAVERVGPATVAGTPAKRKGVL
jgi:hypothetical protein